MVDDGTKQSELAKLSKVDLRNVWGNEALDFTVWLSTQENLELLGSEIGVDIKLIQTEANVGKYSVDILAEEESSGRKIIIENQLEATNHEHLGKIVTYASGHDAEIVIWIVRDLPEPLVKRLRATAKRRGVSEAEIVRSILDVALLALLNPDNCIVGGDEATGHTRRVSQR